MKNKNYHSVIFSNVFTLFCWSVAGLAPKSSSISQTAGMALGKNPSSCRRSAPAVPIAVNPAGRHESRATNTGPTCAPSAIPSRWPTDKGVYARYQNEDVPTAKRHAWYWDGDVAWMDGAPEALSLLFRWKHFSDSIDPIVKSLV